MTLPFFDPPVPSWRHRSSTLVAADAACIKNFATCSMSSGFMPLLVSAGVPSRTPPGFWALTSPSSEFLFAVMAHAERAFSSLLPVRESGRASQRSKWLSVPPDEIVWFIAISDRDRVCEGREGKDAMLFVVSLDRQVDSRSSKK